MTDIKKLLDFVQFTNAFRDVERAIDVPHKNRRENDAEHSYQLALMGWYLVETEKLSFDVGKVIRYALVHDLVETYAGDEQAHRRTEEAAQKKHEREAAALKRIAEEFPQTPELIALMTSYEKREDPESIFIYALDKLLPILNLYLNGGYTWKRLGITLEEVRALKERTLSDSPEVYEIWKLFEPILEKEELRLFPTPATK